MSKGPHRSRSWISIGLGLPGPLASRHSGGGVTDLIRRIMAAGAQAASRSTSRGAYATDSLTLDGGGNGTFTWHPGVSGTFKAEARADVVGDVPDGADLWVSLTDDNTHGYQHSVAYPGDSRVAGRDVWVTSADTLTFSISCPDAPGATCNAVFAATPIND